jgi:hypothetical protein
MSVHDYGRVSPDSKRRLHRGANGGQLIEVSTSVATQARAKSAHGEDPKTTAVLQDFEDKVRATSAR